MPTWGLLLLYINIFVAGAASENTISTPGSSNSPTTPSTTPRSTPRSAPRSTPRAPRKRRISRTPVRGANVESTIKKALLELINQQNRGPSKEEKRRIRVIYYI